MPIHHARSLAFSLVFIFYVLGPLTTSGQTSSSSGGASNVTVTIPQSVTQNGYTGSVPLRQPTPGVLSISFLEAIDRGLKQNLGLLLSEDNTISARGEKWKELSNLLPNVMATILILATIGLGTVILAESGLSFLGFGIPAPYPSWGGMLSGSGRSFMYYAPWMALFPAAAISLAVFGFNMLGDALRDVLDPRLRGAGGLRG